VNAKADLRPPMGAEFRKVPLFRLNKRPTHVPEVRGNIFSASIMVLGLRDKGKILRAIELFDELDGFEAMVDVVIYELSQDPAKLFCYLGRSLYLRRILEFG